MIICFSLEDAELFHSDAMSYEMELFRADRWSCIVNSNHSSASYEFTPCVVLRSEKRRQFLQEHKLLATEIWHSLPKPFSAAKHFVDFYVLFSICKKHDNQGGFTKIHTGDKKSFRANIPSFPWSLNWVERVKFDNSELVFLNKVNQAFGFDLIVRPFFPIFHNTVDIRPVLRGLFSRGTVKKNVERKKPRILRIKLQRCGSLQWPIYNKSPKIHTCLSAFFVRLASVGRPQIWGIENRPNDNLCLSEFNEREYHPIGLHTAGMSKSEAFVSYGLLTSLCC